MDVGSGHAVFVEIDGAPSPSKNDVHNLIDLTAEEGEEKYDENERHRSYPRRRKLSCVLPNTPQTLESGGTNLQFEDEGYHTGVLSTAILPITPSPTPRTQLKRTFSQSSNGKQIELTDKPTKRILFPTKDRNSSAQTRCLFSNIPSFSILAKPRPFNLSPDEVKRISESIVEQVDCDEVADYVASNRDAMVYKSVFKSIMQARVDALEARAEGGDMSA
ncbi:MAG: hypothetical protein M1812_007666 [Candelaria pacifica]|nr:MAG: hypothetical protein M1812_007666 [Candelaria pacifica]